MKGSLFNSHEWEVARDITFIKLNHRNNPCGLKTRVNQIELELQELMNSDFENRVEIWAI